MPRMNTRSHMILLAGAMSVTLTSCITGTLAAAGAAGGGVAGLQSITDIFGGKAPQASELSGHSLVYQGRHRGADKATINVNGSLAFANENPAIIITNGEREMIFYSRDSDKKATVTLGTDAGTETFHLKFDSGSEGTYTYEKRKGEDTATGEGSFVIK